ncbi:myoD family inhibitor isoform X1 [Osmerus mordax]|uniref:myoD family inhibitor isoform X1 n=1 Tax=Osmerus mordax TaxID=8014 RepID=UPI00350F4A0D
MEAGVPPQGGEGSFNTQTSLTQTGPTKGLEQSECPIITQPLPNRTLPEHTKFSSETDRTEDGDSDDSMTDNLSTNDVARLLPNHKSTNHKTQKEDPPSKEDSSPRPEAQITGDPPICTPPSASLPPLPPKCNGHGGQEGQGCPGNKNRLPSATKSQQSFKSDAAQIQQVAGDGEEDPDHLRLQMQETQNCCVHCVLACLFCEVLSLCSVLSQCLACGMGCEALCCCGEGASGGMACCDEDACSALWDCGILEDCCESSDCLEICLECCSICFPA